MTAIRPYLPQITERTMLTSDAIIVISRQALEREPFYLNQKCHWEDLFFSAILLFNGLGNIHKVFL